MSAFVQHEFGRGFFLDEERIRKIHELIVKRLPETAGYPPLEYKVYRSDSFTYTTTDVHDIINEKNSESQKIDRLHVKIDNKDKLRLSLDFRVGENTRLLIEGEDRDLVFLLFSDLRQYLDNEVNIRRGIPEDFFLYALIFGTIGGFLLASYLIFFSASAPEGDLAQIIASQDMMEKLNFILKRYSQPLAGSNFGGVGAGMLLMFLSLMVLLLSRMISDTFWDRLSYFLAPRDLFVFGKEIEKYAASRKMRSNVFWVIVVGIVVSIIAGLVVWFITR